MYPLFTLVTYKALFIQLLYVTVCFKAQLWIKYFLFSTKAKDFPLPSGFILARLYFKFVTVNPHQPVTLISQNATTALMTNAKHTRH